MQKQILLSLTLCLLVSPGWAGTLLDSLNGMQAYMTGEPTFDPVFYDRLSKCLNKLDPRLMESADAQWAGMVSYANTQGNNQTGDIWPPCPTNQKWFESNCTTQEYGQMPIYEPCNYASNIAYYHTVTEICDHPWWYMPQDQVVAMGQVFSILAQGSAFFHGSQTSIGGSADVRINDLFAYVAYQAAVMNLEPLNSSVIHDLSRTPRSKSGAEITSEFIDMYIQVPVEEWGHLLDDADFPSLRLGMCGYFSTVLTLLYPPEVVDVLVEVLLGIFSDIPEDVKVFCLEDFLPEVRVATSHVNMTAEEKSKFQGNTFSTLIKLVYAFLWQEEVLTSNDIWLQPSTNEIGMYLLPLVNGIANGMNHFHYNESTMQIGYNMYPGDSWCNYVIPHAKWHLETGIALTDFVFLSDEMYNILN